MLDDAETVGLTLRDLVHARLQDYVLAFVCFVDAHLVLQKSLFALIGHPGLRRMSFLLSKSMLLYS